MRHLLIIGSQRSGTSLLATLLGSQNDIAVSSEVKTRAWRHVLSHHVVGVKLCVPEQIMLNQPGRFARIGRRIAKNTLRPLHKHIGPRVRLPGRELSSVSIMEFFQLEKPLIVGVLRDPHEVVHSIQVRGEQPYREALRQYRSAVDSIYAAWRFDPERVIPVDFDSLVHDPHRVVRLCCEALDQEFNPERVSGFTKNYKNAAFDKSKAGGRALTDRLRHPALDGDVSVRGKYAELLRAAI